MYNQLSQQKLQFLLLLLYYDIYTPLLRNPTHDFVYAVTHAQTPAAEYDRSDLVLNSDADKHITEIN